MSSQDTDKDKEKDKTNNEDTSNKAPLDSAPDNSKTDNKKEELKKIDPELAPEDPVDNDYSTSEDISKDISKDIKENSEASDEEKKITSSEEKKTEENNLSAEVNTEPDGTVTETTTETFTKSEAKEEIKNLLQQKDSNYQISLINENLLKIVVTTDRGVNIDCSVKERKNSKETQSNKIYLHPKPDNIKQEIEIIISIDSATGEVTVQKKNDSSEEITPGVLTPNPELAHLVQPYPFNEEELTIEKTPQELLEERLGKKNPYNVFRLFYQRNLTIGIVGAIIIQSFMILCFYAFIGKFDNKPDENDNKRLIVISDMPDPKINIKEFVDPNKPVEPPKTDDSKITKLPGDNPFSINRTIKPPRIKRPQLTTVTPRDTTKIDSTQDLTHVLDSLRKLNGKNPKDSIKKDTTGITNTTPVDTTHQFRNDEVGLYIPYKQLAPYLKLVDSREINTNTVGFTGVILSDTSTSVKGTMNLFINLDKDGADLDRYFKGKGTPFPMVDTTLTAIYLEPKKQIGHTYYYFYVFGKQNKVSIALDTKTESFDKYKTVVEQLVKNIRIN